jgi:DNA-binding XRE family transcriptional regulator
MSEKGWQTVSYKNKQKVITVQEKSTDPIIARQREAHAKLDADKQEAMKIKYDGPKDSNQDWNYVTFSKTKPKQKVSIPQAPPTSFKETKEGEIIKIKKVSKSMGKAVTDARIVKQWTQVQLAHNSTVDSKTINEIERGGCVYDSNIFNKISKALGVKIERNYDLV